MSTSLVIDTETLCRRPTAIITEIGIIAFNRADFHPFDQLEIKPALFPQLAAGRTFDPETIAFHERNGTLPTHTGGTSMADTITLIQAFVLKHNPHRVWIQGTCFDRPIIEDFCTQFSSTLPWHFGISKDARTTWDNSFPGVKHDKRPHRAIPDALATLRDIHTALKAIDRLQAV